MFLTAETFHGDLASQGAAADGLAGADALCTTAATTAGLGGVWFAWLSTTSVNAISRLDADKRWTLVDGTTEAFASRLGLQFGPKHAIDVTAAGDSLLPSDDPDLRVDQHRQIRRPLEQRPNQRLRRLVRPDRHRRGSVPIPVAFR